MLGIIAVVLVVLWLLGYFTFHVSSGLVHVVLVVGLVLLLVHFLRGRA
ncbi:MAG TPA: lmo0937 family membrane protein [Candidatus Dormibacteraeota bacterium]|nr:lmo0937 family membrane protein [Candidatus Dormibacteraeota bacterium]